MKDDELKNIWNMMNNQTTMPHSMGMPKEQFINTRSGSIQAKIGNMLRYDLILKLVSGLALLLNLLFYQNITDVLYVCLAGLAFLGIMTTIEWKALQEFNLISDPSRPSRENLSNILVFLRRKSHIFIVSIASTGILVYVSGLLLYFYAAYGYLKPLTGESFMVFTTLLIIGTAMSILSTRSQLNFHIKHITACLSDLNENSLGFVTENIERQRKQDRLIKTLVMLLLVFGFVLFIAVMKAITS
jgi:hypothetical protein